MLGRQIEYTASPERLQTAYSFFFLTARDPMPRPASPGSPMKRSSPQDPSGRRNPISDR